MIATIDCVVLLSLESARVVYLYLCFKRNQCPCTFSVMRHVTFDLPSLTTRMYEPSSIIRTILPLQFPMDALNGQDCRDFLRFAPEPIQRYASSPNHSQFAESNTHGTVSNHSLTRNCYLIIVCFDSSSTLNWAPLPRWNLGSSKFHLEELLPKNRCPNFRLRLLHCASELRSIPAEPWY